MLRIYQYTIQLLIVGQIFFNINLSWSQSTKPKTDSVVFHYKLGINGTFDKSLVTRLIFNTQNSFVFRNNWASFEPTFNYRFGYVQPANRPKTDLENDILILLKCHFWYQNKVFPSVFIGFENSPNIRQLDNRLFMGMGLGSFLLKSKNHQLQATLYGMYEQSDFETFRYEVFRMMPFIKGNHFLQSKHMGVSYTLQPFMALNSKENQRFRGTLRPYFKLSKTLEFSISYDLWYESLVSGTQPKEISVILLGFNYSNF